MNAEDVTSLIAELRGASDRTQGNPLYGLAADAIVAMQARIVELEAALKAAQPKVSRYDD